MSTSPSQFNVSLLHRHRKVPIALLLLVFSSVAPLTYAQPDPSALPISRREPSLLVTGFKFTGNSLLKAEELQKVLVSKTEVPLNRENITADIAALQKIYTDKGFSAQVIKVQRDIQGLLSFTLLEAKVTHINLSGLTTTDPAPLRKLITTLVDEPYDVAKVGRDMSALNATNLFAQVALKVDTDPNVLGGAMVTFVLKERPVPQGSAYEPLAVAPQEGDDFLAGRIVDGAGKPIVGATVDAFHWFPGSETTTDATGAFRLSNTDLKRKYLEAGDKIEVTFSAPGYTPRYIAVQPLGTLQQPALLKADTFLEGVVRAADGQPVPGAKVRAVAGPFESDDVTITEVPYSTLADAKGHYKLFVPGDTYELFVVGDKGVSRTKGVEVAPGTRLEKNVSLQPGVLFRAHVVDSVSGQPVRGVDLFNFSPTDIRGQSDKDGNIVIPNMYSGSFQWAVEAPGIARWWSEQASKEYEHKDAEAGSDGFQRNFDSLDFDIKAGMPPVTIVVERGVRIRGHVLDPMGQPVSDATVAPALTGTGNSLTGDTRFSVLTNARGEFEGLFPAGKARQWNLIAHDGDYDEWRHFANATSAPFSTQPGQVIENFTLKLVSPTTITGHVVDGQGHAVPRAEVRAVQADNRGNRYYDPTTKTDEKGDFVLGFVAPGKHFVQVEPFWLSTTDAPSASTKTVEVKAGEPAEIGTLTQVPDH